MEYINKNHIKRYRRTYIKQIVKDVWGMEYTPLALAALLIVAVYLLALTKLVDYIVGGL